MKALVAVGCGVLVAVTGAAAFIWWTFREEWK